MERTPGGVGAETIKSQDTICSIVAADPKSGLFGVACVSSATAVGKTVPFSGAFAGVIAVQGYTSPYFGVIGMKLLREGLKADEVLDAVLSEDPIRQSRQILILDAAGQTAVFTGSALPEYTGALEGDRYAVGGVGLSGERLLSDCAKAFEKTQGDLPDRLLATIAVAAKSQNRAPSVSAVLRVSKDKPHPYVDLRVDRHDEPVEHLRVLLKRWREKNAPDEAN